MKIIYASLLALLLLFSCDNQNNETKLAAISSIDNLKRGDVISCGPQVDDKFGKVFFQATVPENLKSEFNTAVALLHSFEYDDAEKMFAKVIDKAPGCAMAYWGVAMSNFHPLWSTPSDAELKKGLQAVRIAQGIKQKEQRETDYINAIGQFYEDADHLDHHSRVLKFENAMEKVYTQYPSDKEAAVFYALALNAAADPTDKTYVRQKKAVSILQPIFDKEPLHPGIAHYIIHNYDYPGLAELALRAARKYASIAPASAHAQHMPSHIFTRLGLWDECIQSNLSSVSSAQCYAQQLHIKHWDEELHGLDYLVYAYLQKGDNENAKQELDYLYSIDAVDPVNFKTSYAFAAIPARYYLENKMWKEAAAQKLHPSNYPWEKFPWQKAIFHFSRFLGEVNTSKKNEAKLDLDSMRLLYQQLSKMKDKTRESAEVAMEIKTSEAWWELYFGDKNIAVQMMNTAANMEDAMDKHPVTPGAVLPARELLGEMYLLLNQPQNALKEFETELVSSPNRFNAVYGAAVAAMKTSDKMKAGNYFKQLTRFSDPHSSRREIQMAKKFIVEN